MAIASVTPARLHLARHCAPTVIVFLFFFERFFSYSTIKNLQGKAMIAILGLLLLILMLRLQL